MPEYAKLDVNNVVTQVIVADQDHVDSRADGPWNLTPAKVGIGHRKSSSGNVYVSKAEAYSIASPEKLTLDVSASGGSGPLTYQWKKDGADIAGATSAQYSKDPTSSPGDSGSYTCVVSDGTDSVESEPFSVTVV